ncbi:hypothetical protein BDU57DRAFT_549526 [Ampelomyces quisqualis]|uniref:Uncharacterized protein n=1 Tax=Ampelomyces quisqualis TaxID=50730 RepID=A0A6A5QFL3_AMPQU|nr:hypothetical protein BDU57DRAFT_549526 [Ampelomyces quisqualis]
MAYRKKPTADDLRKSKSNIDNDGRSPQRRVTNVSADASSPPDAETRSRAIAKKTQEKASGPQSEEASDSGSSNTGSARKTSKLSNSRSGLLPNSTRHDQNFVMSDTLSSPGLGAGTQDLLAENLSSQNTMRLELDLARPIVEHADEDGTLLAVEPPLAETPYVQNQSDLVGSPIEQQEPDDQQQVGPSGVPRDSLYSSPSPGARDIINARIGKAAVRRSVSMADNSRRTVSAGLMQNSNDETSEPVAEADQPVGCI